MTPTTPHSAEDLLVRHLAKIVDSSDDAIVSKDLDGTILSWNAAAERMFGYTASEAIGKSIRIIIPDDRQQEEDFVLAQVRRGESIRHYETIRQRKDGSQLEISLTVSPVYDGTVIAASKIARDISEQSRLRAVAQEQAQIAHKLSEVGAILARSLERGTIVQKVTDVATELTSADFGAFFYDVADPQSGESELH